VARQLLDTLASVGNPQVDIVVLVVQTVKVDILVSVVSVVHLLLVTPELVEQVVRPDIVVRPEHPVPVDIVELVEHQVRVDIQALVDEVDIVE